MGYDNNSFWIEDLGSTNGTFVEGERISGRVNFIPGQRVRLGGETVIGGVEKAQDVELYRNIEGEDKQDDPRGKYPCVVSNSELIKPARIPLVLGRTISMGRDPSNDIWVGASHISRNHCYVTFEDSGTISVKDESSNGTFLGESKLNKGEATDIVPDNSVIHLGSELCIKVCFDKASEEAFLEEHKQSEPEFVKEPDINAMELTSLSVKAVSPSTDDPENRIEGDGVFAKLARKRSSESNLLNPVLDPNRMQSKLSTQSIQRKNSSRLITSLALVLCILILIGWIAYNLYRII
jgi:pSer/pThr/pTyr-binding forkhead associated (FHA) protein